MSELARRPILRSERLFLRPAEQDDGARFVEWLNDADFTETLAPRGPMSTSAEQTWFDELQQEQGKTRWHFVICLRADERPIGLIGFDSLDLLNGSAELGIGIAERSLWDQGLGTDAMGIVLDFGFGELRLHRVYLHVFEGNDRARHLYHKLGFVHEGTERQMPYRHGRHMDVHLMAYCAPSGRPWTGHAPGRRSRPAHRAVRPCSGGRRILGRVWRRGVTGRFGCIERIIAQVAPEPHHRKRRHGRDHEDGA